MNWVGDFPSPHDIDVPGPPRHRLDLTVDLYTNGTDPLSPESKPKEEPVTPPVPEYLSPLRWRWILLTTQHHEVRFLYWPPRRPAGHRRIRMFDRDGYDIGTLVWRVCDACRVGSINKISITIEHQRQGLGRRLIRRALADGPGYTWQTTGQSPEAKQFFPALESDTGVAFPEYGGTCEHLASPPGYQPPPPGHRPPRPVLERSI